VAQRAHDERRDRDPSLAARATRERGRRTLAKLRAAAVAEFSAYGYHGARVARVAKRAGTSHGTFYVYFADKNDLLVALQQEMIENADEVMERLPALRLGPDGFTELRAWMDEACALLIEQAPIRSAVFDAMLEDTEPRVTRQGLRAHRRWSTLLADRIRAAGASHIDSNLAAVSLINVMDSACRAVGRSQFVVSHDELVDALTELFHRSVFGVTPRRTRARPKT
jgi:AcrR family transcriptional regulator